MKKRKVFWKIIWLLVIIIGALTHKYVPEDFIYTYGFVIGTISFACLRISNLN